MHAFLMATVFAAAFQPRPVAVGDTAPKLAAATPDGAPVVEDWSKGDVVVVAFFATWCGPCHRALRELGSIRQALGPRLRFVMVEAGDDAAAIKRFIADNPLPGGATVVTDPSGSLSQRWGVTIIPSFFIIDRARTVRYINHGWGDSTEPHFLHRLQNVLEDARQ